MWRWVVMLVVACGSTQPEIAQTQTAKELGYGDLISALPEESRFIVVIDVARLRKSRLLNELWDRMQEISEVRALFGGACVDAAAKGHLLVVAIDLPNREAVGFRVGSTLEDDIACSKTVGAIAIAKVNNIQREVVGSMVVETEGQKVRQQLWFEPRLAVVTNNHRGERKSLESLQELARRTRLITRSVLDDPFVYSLYKDVDRSAAIWAFQLRPGVAVSIDVTDRAHLKGRIYTDSAPKLARLYDRALNQLERDGLIASHTVTARNHTVKTYQYFIDDVIIDVSFTRDQTLQLITKFAEIVAKLDSDRLPD